MTALPAGTAEAEQRVREAMAELRETALSDSWTDEPPGDRREGAVRVRDAARAHLGLIFVNHGPALLSTLAALRGDLAAMTERADGYRTLLILAAAGQDIRERFAARERALDQARAEGEGT